MTAAVRLPALFSIFLGGLVVGLGIAAGTAVYITKAPVPFVSKVQRLTDTLTPDSNDPNQPLFSPLIPGPGTQTAGTPASATATGAAAAAVATNNAAMTNATMTNAPTNGATPGATAGAAPAGPGTLLQIGAYRTPDDADAMRARLALMGFDAKVAKTTEEGGLAVYRVRLGPYGPADDVNGILRTLSENGVDAQQVPAP
jgi:Cell division protein